MIYYFSGTGNSLWAARYAAEKTGDGLKTMTSALADGIVDALSDGEKLGIVFPVHGWRVPRLVRRFLDELISSGAHEGHYIYMVITAGDSIGRAFERMEKAIGSKLSIDACATLIMPESYVGLPGMDVDTEERELEKKAEAEKTLDRFLERWVAGSREPFKQGCRPAEAINLVRGPLPGFFSGPVGGFFEKHLITDKPFHVDADRCTRCGRCAAVCPVSDISGGKGMMPQWLHNGQCLTCFSCYHHCPTHAIEYGRRTKKKGQYFFDKRKRKQTNR